MTKITDETIIAFVDGELPPDEAASVRTAISNNETLAANAARYRALRSHIDQAFGSVVREPLPDRFHQLFQDVKPSPIPASFPLLGRWSSAMTSASWGAIAASLAIGVIVGNLFMAPHEPTLDFALYQDGGAEGLLAVLIKEPSGAPIDGAEIIATYQNTEGDICRKFVIGDERRGQGLACRQRGGGDWSVVAFSPAPPPNSYLPAGEMTKVSSPMAFTALLEGFQTVTPEEEVRLIDEGWE